MISIAKFLAPAMLLIACTPISGGAVEEAEVIVFRDADGRTITLADLKDATGTFCYEIIGAGDVSAEASRLHQAAREAGQRGEYQQAITLLTTASALAPRWPYPIYDRAYTNLLMGDIDAARADYKRTVELAPRGYFTAITAVDILDRERAGEFPPGTYLAYLMLEWIDDRAKRIDMTRRIVNGLPRFAPGWKDLVYFAEQDTERIAAIENGLAAAPDAETRGMLQINKALVLDRQGDHEGAVRLLGGLVLDPHSTSGTEQLAKATLATITKK